MLGSLGQRGIFAPVEYVIRGLGGLSRRYHDQLVVVLESAEPAADVGGFVLQNPIAQNPGLMAKERGSDLGYQFLACCGSSSPAPQLRCHATCSSCPPKLL